MAGKIEEVKLKNCKKAVPVIGMGTAPHGGGDGKTAKAAILEAIKAGYRHFDTAFVYGSEAHIGEAIAEALSLGIISSRDELFITTKLWATFAQPHLVVPALHMSLRNLDMDYVDMYIIHWPFKLSQEVKTVPVEKEDIQPLDLKLVWKAMEECLSLGLTKGIGVSNFSCKMLDQLLSVARIPPALNQVEMSPAWQQKRLREFCKAKGIHITAYSPLGASRTQWGNNRIIGSDILQEIANSKGKTTAQISLRWVYEQGVSLVTKSYNSERMRQNLDIFGWSLTQEDLDNIDQFPQSKGLTFASIVGPHDLVLEIDADI